MSLITRILGFALCVGGAFLVGYSRGLGAAAGSTNDLAYRLTGDKPDFAQAVGAQVSSYIQQTIDPTLNTYLVVGIALAIIGAILVARGDGKMKSLEVALQSRAPPVTRQND